MSQSRPLEGLRVIELGQLLAGPFAGTVLGYFGAEVIKVELLRATPSANGVRSATACRCGITRWRETKRA